MIYINFEPFAHLFLTYGLAASDIVHEPAKAPHHVLLLPPIDEDEFIDPHTGFNVISGQEAVSTFMRSQEASGRSWLDYQHGAYLQELTPSEIAELLYLGHMKTHMQSPFYYKLQNNFVVLPLHNAMTNLYFRHLSAFDFALSSAIRRHLRWAANEQPFWLRLRQQQFPIVPPETLKPLRQLMTDGIVFDFSHVIFSREHVKLPVIQPTQRFIPERDVVGNQVGSLTLNRMTKQWQFDQNKVAESDLIN
ncbi:hypothetical protein IV56_GL000380 [Lacticaseibacillus saniviri JCM 17471 = DSM 24301]|uniref:Uncharacterized protein n=2 Tax=Lacticaseibacillus saniviri TaxID=931533 RepID=A0A0R2MWH7_9LACO|nr:hypothetical protein [Lacticaseibacillus saniviri]KRO17260.1 hypothetical protein IV56_GL000380 [Lacticaseibacillus saniviri JCM 17471 = DSM 24301]MCG4282445.1 hypothetical protein [Lacticaseibacillus saniviri]